MGPPRVSQMPSSGWSQWSQSQSARVVIVSQWRAGDGPVPAIVEVDRVHELAVDVELKLLGRGVPDPYRLRPPVAGQVTQFPLGKLGAPVDAVHHLHRARGARLARGGVPEELHEGVGLAGESQPQQRVDAEGRVADPHVPVVPVARPADLLGQAGRRRGDDGAGRGVGQQLQRQRRAVYHLPPPAPVARGRQPAPPEPAGDGQQFLRLRAGTRDRLRAAAELVQREHRRLALGQLELGCHITIVVLDRHRRGQANGQAGCGEDRPALHLGERVRVHAVAKSRRDARPERHGPPHAQHPTDQPVPPRLGRAAGRHEILDLTDPVLGGETGDQHVGIGVIELPGCRRHRGAQLKRPATVGVQERAEHGRGVERRAAIPVDGPVGSD